MSTAKRTIKIQMNINLNTGSIKSSVTLTVKRYVYIYPIVSCLMHEKAKRHQPENTSTRNTRKVLQNAYRYVYDALIFSYNVSCLRILSPDQSKIVVVCLRGAV